MPLPDRWWPSGRCRTTRRRCRGRAFLPAWSRSLPEAFLYRRMQSSTHRAGLAGAGLAEVGTARPPHIGRPRLPPCRFGTGVQNPGHADRAQLLFGMGNGTVAHDVDATQLDRIHAEFFGTDVQVGRGGKMAFYPSEAAKRSTMRVIGVDSVDVKLDIRNF